MRFSARKSRAAQPGGSFQKQYYILSDGANDTEILMTNFKTIIITSALLVGTTAVSFAGDEITAADTHGGTVAETISSGGYV